MSSDTEVTAPDAAHLLRRVGYGGSAQEIRGLAGKTRRECVDIVLGFSEGDVVPEGPDVGQPEWVLNTDEFTNVADEMILWWIDRMSTLPNPVKASRICPTRADHLPIYERLAFFWHDHFACDIVEVGDKVAMWDQIRMFRRLAMANFDSLTRETAVHPAMLVMLDNRSNKVETPQENFSRELMELYTCGIGHFSESDVVAMTRAWTGHLTNVSNGDDPKKYSDFAQMKETYIYEPEAHDHGRKYLFGINANWNGIAQNPSERDAIEELILGAKRDATSLRLAELICKYFCNPEPSSGFVEDVSSAFSDSGMEISALVRSVLLHDEFWSLESRWALVKDPIDYVVSILKHTGLSSHEISLDWTRLESMGMVPFHPPSVAGWGSGTDWLATSSMAARGKIAHELHWRETVEKDLENLMDLSVDEAVERILDFYGLQEVSGGTRQVLSDWFRRARHKPWWTTSQARTLGVLVPEFQVR